MTFLEFVSHNLTGVILIITNFVLLIGAYYRLKFKSEKVMSDIKAIEDKRLNNVAFLREVYDAKIEDSRKDTTKQVMEVQKDMIVLKSNQEAIKQTLTAQNAQILDLIERLEKNHEAFIAGQKIVNDKLADSIDAIKNSLIENAGAHSRCLFYNKGISEVKDIVGVEKK